MRPCKIFLAEPIGRCDSLRLNKTTVKRFFSAFSCQLPNFIDSIDDMVKNYQDLSDMIILLNKSFSSDELADDGIYQALVSEQTILKNKVDTYNSAISFCSEKETGVY